MPDRFLACTRSGPQVLSFPQPHELTSNRGNDYLLQVDQFQQYYDALPDNMVNIGFLSQEQCPQLMTTKAAPEQYEALLPFRQARFNDSIANNPYFFYPQFAGVLVSPAGYAFPPAMMSNKSAEYPEGYLDKASFMSFFAITGESGSFTYQPGWERIPDNFYKRAIGDEYTIPGYVAFTSCLTSETSSYLTLI